MSNNSPSVPNTVISRCQSVNGHTLVHVNVEQDGATPASHMVFDLAYFVCATWGANLVTLNVRDRPYTFQFETTDKAKIFYTALTRFLAHPPISY
jgi:hypothetical protein